ncbi:MAG TPA: glycosyltransferase family 4 protein [Edaphocola sp.]|nr:glycosyltransferase family 4 protein [Edaphocola sp.]
MFYFRYGIVLFILMWVYVWFARRNGIIDKPNERSSHYKAVVRGAGVVFPLSLIVFKVTYSQYYINFSYVFVGAMLISIISFIDDLKSLPVYIRFPIHIISVALLIYGFDIFSVWNWWSLLVLMIIMLGIVNAYNFMDGINGITALYSLIAFCSFWYVIKYVEHIDSTAFVNYGIVSCLVFLFFNFRKNALCFLGDVGSIGLGFWIIAALAYVIFWSYHFEYILFLSVYLLDTGFTFFQRLLNGENVIKPHRKHLYQLLVNEYGLSHLMVATIYAGVQLIINAFVISSNYPLIPTTMLIAIPLIFVYVLVKRNIIGPKIDLK